MTFLERVGAARTALHNGQASQKLFREGHDHIGLTGEHAFALRYGLPLDLRERVSGDGGTDFVVPIRNIADVKTTSYDPPWLIVPVKDIEKRVANIFVGAMHLEGDDAVLFGWQWAAACARAPIEQMKSGPAHVIKDKDGWLDMAELDERVMVLKVLK